MRFFPSDTKIDFLGKRKLALGFSIFCILATAYLLPTRGLNFGIDFTGGILIETRFEQVPDLAKMREGLKEKHLGDVSLQSFGDSHNVLIRLGQQAGGEKERIHAVDQVKSTLATDFPGKIDYRKVDYVGPKVGGELIKDGAIALLLTFAGIMCYVWIRFEWQYGVGAILALFHDAVITLGFFSITQLEFNLSCIAAILTIIGYSINDSVVIFDRIRDDIRKYKSMPIAELLNVSINHTLARTILTSSTVLLAVLALVFVGGEVIKSFSLSTFFGIIIGTYSSIYISAPVLIYMNLRRPNAQRVPA
jgi:preprotein translocase subunit SecF